MGNSKGVVFVQVLDIHKVSDEMHIFTVTDGTLFIYCFHLDEDERHATREVRIIILDPSPEVKEIQVNITVFYNFSMSFKFTCPGVTRPFYINTLTVPYISSYIKILAVRHKIILTVGHLQ
jgi:hypothetical protein